MKGMADALRDLGWPVEDRILVLNIVCGLNDNYSHLKTWIAKRDPFPSFLQLRDDLVLEEIIRGFSTGSSSTALVAAPPAATTSSPAPPTAAITSSPVPPAAPPAHFLLGAPPPGSTVVEGAAVAVDGGVGAVVLLVGVHRCLLPPLLLLVVLPGHLLQPMVRAHLDVVVPGPRGGPRAQHQPSAMFAGVAPSPPPPAWVPPTQPPSAWPAGWDQAVLARSFSSMGLTPPVGTEWIADSGASYHTTPTAGFGFPASTSPM